MPLEKDAIGRLKAARSRKSEVEKDLKEAIFFSAHWRSRQVTSETDPSKSRVREDEDSPATSLFSEVSGDFTSHVMDTFMPQFADWAQRGPGMMTDAATWKKVQRKVSEADKQVMAAIRASGFNAAAYQAFNPDLFVGTCAMWIDPAQVSFHLPMCWGVPIRELEINIGPLGDIDDRFVVKHMTFAQARVLLGPKAVYSQEINSRYGETKRCAVTLGFWRKYEPDGQVRWQYVALLDKNQVNEDELEGEGSCPLIPFRWEPDSDHPFGTGPQIKCLPTARVIDALDAAQQDRAEYSISPSFTYPNDGVINFDNGIEAGKGYPILPGGGDDIKELYFKGDPNAGFYTVAELERRVRRIAFVDFPQQEGKTPPSASQWLDEMVKAQRRIGPPGQKFWREGPREVFLRFKFMLEKAGIIQPITRGDQDGALVSLEAINPAAKAMRLERVEQAVKFAEIARIIAPEESQLAIDGMKTIQNIHSELNEDVVVMRSEEDMKKALQQLVQLSGGGMGAEAAPVAA